MMAVARRRQIVNSYSKVLADILICSENKESFFQELYNFVDKIDNQSFSVNPLIYNKYRNAIKDITCSFNITNEVQKFVLLILKRHYGCLLGEIIEQTKQLLNNKLHRTEVFVLSKNELSAQMKQKIEKEISNQIDNVEIEYKIDTSIKENCINFMSNGNICCLDLKKISEKFFLS